MGYCLGQVYALFLTIGFVANYFANELLKTFFHFECVLLTLGIRYIHRIHKQWAMSSLVYSVFEDGLIHLALPDLLILGHLVSNLDQIQIRLQV